jgi:putative membrane protein (TIGR04086 family)
MKILWWRILIAAIVLELLYGVFLVFVLGAAEQAFTAFGVASVFVFMAIGGFWLGSRATSHPVLQGGLVGVVAVVFYTALTTPAVLSGELAVTGPFLLNHLAKVLGGTFGGLLASIMSASRKHAAAQELTSGDQD